MSRRLTSEQCEKTSRQRLRERGVASLIDFAFGMALLGIVFGAFIFFGSTILASGATTAASGDVAAQAAADRLVEDVFVSEPNDPQANQACVNAFFDQGTLDFCGHNDQWGNRDYYHDSLGIGFGNVNITLHDQQGNTAQVGGVETIGGDPVPQNGQQIHRAHRYVLLQADGDAEPQIYTLRVRYWD